MAKLAKISSYTVCRNLDYFIVLLLSQLCTHCHRFLMHLLVSRSSMTYKITCSGLMSLTVGVMGEPLAQLASFTTLTHQHSTLSALKSSTVPLCLSQSLLPTFSTSPLMIVILSNWSHQMTFSSLEMSSTTPTRE